MALIIIHISDVHIGAKLKFLAGNAVEHRQSILDTFTKTVDLAIEKKVNFFIITGDLFDSPYPDETNINFVKKAFQSLIEKKIYVAIIPGNHDHLAEGSIFEESALVKLARESKYLHVFKDEKKTTWNIEEVETAIYGVPTFFQQTTKSPLEKVKINENMKYHICLLHGSVMQSSSSQTNSPINIEKIKEYQFNYLALGDWHSSKQILEKPQTWYSGSPELLNISQKNSGKIIYAEFDEKETSVELIQVGSKRVVSAEINLSQIKSEQELIDMAISEVENGHENIFLALRLTGLRKLSMKFNLDELVEELGKKYYYVKIKDVSNLNLSASELSQFPEELIVGKYIRFLQNKKTDDYAQNQLLDEAIQYGVQLLTDI